MCLADWSTLLQSMHIHAKLASLRAGVIPIKGDANWHDHDDQRFLVGFVVGTQEKP